MSRTWQENADEYGRLTRQGKDVHLALLVACSVENRGHGGDRRSSNNHYLKVSASEFARQAGTSAPRVLRYLDAWDGFAKAAGLPFKADLSPDDYTLEISEEQAAVFATIRITPAPKPPAAVTTPTPPAPEPAAASPAPAPPRPGKGTWAEQHRPHERGWHMARSEREALGIIAEDYYVNGGYSLNEIQRAAGLANNATIKKILNDRGVETNKRQARKEDPPPIHWRPTGGANDEATPAPHRLSGSSGSGSGIVERDPREDGHVYHLRDIRRACEAQNDMNRLAYLFDQIAEEGDVAWLDQVRADLEWAATRLGNLARLTHDAEYREVCKSDPSVRDDWQKMNKMFENE